MELVEGGLSRRPMVALLRLGLSEEPSTHLVFDCTDIIQKKSTSIALHVWIDVVDIAMVVGIA